MINVNKVFVQLSYPNVHTKRYNEVEISISELWEKTNVSSSYK